MTDQNQENVGGTVVTETAPPAPQAAPAPETGLTIEQLQKQLAEANERVKKAEGQYGGQKGYAEQLAVQLETLKQTYSDETKTLQVKLAELEGTTKTVSKQLAEKDALITQMQKEQQEQATAKALAEKVKSFADTNSVPELVKMHSDGLMLGIATMSEEELTDYLTKTANLFGGIKSETAKDVTGGSVPPPPTSGNSGSNTLMDVKRRLASLKPGQPGYDEAFAEYERLIYSEK